MKRYFVAFSVLNNENQLRHGNATLKLDDGEVFSITKAEEEFKKLHGVESVIAIFYKQMEENEVYI